MRHKPDEVDDRGFHEVNVTKTGEHSHKVQNNQIRGEFFFKELGLIFELFR